MGTVLGILAYAEVLDAFLEHLCKLGVLVAHMYLVLSILTHRHGHPASVAPVLHPHA